MACKIPCRGGLKSRRECFGQIRPTQGSCINKHLRPFSSGEQKNTSGKVSCQIVQDLSRDWRSLLTEEDTISVKFPWHLHMRTPCLEIQHEEMLKNTYIFIVGYKNI